MLYKTKTISTILLLLIFFCSIQALNQMETIAFLEGENLNSNFGKYMAALDFNGDGFDDLIVSSHTYNWPDFIGKLYFYLGSDDFDSEADFTLTGNDEDGRITPFVMNLGDVNNDGFEDLGYITQTEDDIYTRIIFGNAEQETSTDYLFTASLEVYSSSEIRPLADINNDGFDDIGLVRKERNYIDPQIEYYFLLGSSSDLYETLFYSVYDSAYGLSGIGDVNSDGYDDFCLGSGTYGEGYTNRFYYGGDQLDVNNYYILWECDLTNNVLSIAAGDLNNDGIDDFAGHFYNGIDVWLGSDNITQQNDFHIYASSGGGGTQGFDYGDMNNDGYSDLVVGTPAYATDDGIAHLYLGSEDPNGTFDMIFQDHGVNEFWGASVEVGNFNGDDYCDVAISAPFDGMGTTPSYVYVYSGNADLEDYVSTDDVEIEKIPLVKFNAYPNPFNPSTLISFSIPEESNVEITIFNIKGQRIRKLIDGNFERGTHESEWNGNDDYSRNVSSGVYFYKLSINGKSEAIKKCLLLK